MSFTRLPDAVRRALRPIPDPVSLHLGPEPRKSSDACALTLFAAPLARRAALLVVSRSPPSSGAGAAGGGRGAARAGPRRRGLPQLSAGRCSAARWCRPIPWCAASPRSRRAGSAIPAPPRSLVPLLADPDSTVRVAAAFALGLLRDTAGAQPLMDQDHRASRARRPDRAGGHHRARQDRRPQGRPLLRRHPRRQRRSQPGGPPAAARARSCSSPGDWGRMRRW